MPKSQFKSVYAVSSEDSIHLADNLLKIQPGKKWKCKNPGESSAFVVLQMDHRHCITGIDIGNEHSAFATVSVGNLPYKDGEFQEILITSSFMTPIESKNSTNTNRVRCFASNALVEPVAKEKWELIKIVCSQPFNRHVQYGLSFITVHVASKATINEGCPSKVLAREECLVQTSDSSDKMALLIREDSPDSESEAGSSLFNRWKQSRGQPSAAAVIRDASDPSALKTMNSGLKPSRLQLTAYDSRKVDKLHEHIEKNIRDRNRDDLFHDEDDEIPNERLEKKILEDKNRLKAEKNTSKEVSRKKNQSGSKSETDTTSVYQSPRKAELNCVPKKDIAEGDGKDISATNSPGSNRKRESSPSPMNTSGSSFKKPKLNTPVEYRPFKELLKGVVLVISGIQNPDRGVLRQKALELGARYKPDWDDSCTHLICAFKNTPKYNQVKNKGKIVTRLWIEKCHSLKKRLPWRRFALDDRVAEKPESEDEVWDMSLKPPDEQVTGSSRKFKMSDFAAERKLKSLEQKQTSQPDDILDTYDKEETRGYLASSGSDTDEEIEKVTRNMEMQLKEESNTYKDGDPIRVIKESPSKRKEKKRKLMVFEASTDEDDTMKGPISEGEKSSGIFDGMNFYLSSNLMASEQLKIKQVIKEFGGQCAANLNEANYHISKKTIEAVEGFQGEIVSPLWIFECQDMECKIPTRRYLL